LIEHGATGLLVPPDSAAALGAALAELAGDPALRARMGGAARAAVGAEFGDAVNWQRLAAALDQAKIAA
jgi:glycosyltransferase involved in cell wall biosynthesis